MKKIYLLSNMFSFRPHSLKENSDLTGLFMHYKAQYEKLMKKLSRVGLLITDFFRAKLTCQEHHKFFQWRLQMLEYWDREREVGITAKRRFANPTTAAQRRDLKQ